jgi:hypothetical protein
MLDFDAYSIISSVVDTRGIDTVASSQKSSNKMKREDILNYIDNEQENCLFFFIDNIKSSPSQNITELLQTRITHENGFRFYIINNIVGSEAEEVMTDNGKAESAEDGIEYKKDDILSKFQQFNIPFSASNLLFYNARINHPSRTDILAVISENINKKHADIYEICEEIRNSFKKTKYDFENNDYALKNFDDLKTIVENVKAPNNLFDIISGRFISELNRIHHARIAAINRYDGEYYAFNFFHEFSLLIESCFDEYFSKSKEKIIDKVNDFL